MRGSPLVFGPEVGRAAQLRALGDDVRDHVWPYSEFWRERLEAAGLTRKSSGAEVLDALPPLTFDEIDDPGRLVLRPDEQSIQRFGSPRLLSQVFWAKATRRSDRVNRRILDPRYKPVHWHVDAGVPVAYSSADVDRLAELGRRVLVSAGLGRYDVVVSMLPPGPHLAYWEVVLGCRRAGLSTLHLPPPATGAQLEAVRPTVLVGLPGDLRRSLEGAGDLPGLHTVVAAGEPLDEPDREALRQLAPHAAVLGAWAPPGVRALWTECRGGDGYHTWPSAELVEVTEDRELLWTGLGWRGTAFLRLRTGVVASLDDTPCLVCGSSAPRVRLTRREPRFVSVLDRTPGVTAWQAELRTVRGVEELLVYVSVDGAGHPGPLLRLLDRDLSVTQFVVLDRPGVEARLAASGGRRVLDRREGAVLTP